MQADIYRRSGLTILTDEKIFIDVPLVHRINRQIQRDIARGKKRKLPEYVRKIFISCRVCEI